ncbi:MAG: hypothetical protein IKC54_02170 [Clostridia bacterium]|nr:hypothetical protein [Clostridia bacterium]
MLLKSVATCGHRMPSASQRTKQQHSKKSNDKPSNPLGFPIDTHLLNGNEKC